MRTSIDFTEYTEKLVDELNKRFQLSDDEIDEIIEYYMYDIEFGFRGCDRGYECVGSIIDSWTKDGKLKWKK